MSDAAAVDFESYYDKEISLRTMGTDSYLAATDVYLVSIFGEGVEYVGHPAVAPWKQIAGRTWISHNASFDARVYRFLAYPWKPSEWQCTADLAAYLGHPRSLKGAAEGLLNLPVKKDVRDKMKGKKWETMAPEFQAEVKAYALEDARVCWQLWEKFSDRWPAWERELSLLTREMGWEGVHINLPKVLEGIAHLQDLIFKAQQSIPWNGGFDKKGEPHAVLSPLLLAEHCRLVGIPAPASLAKDSEECVEWEDKYGGLYPWVSAMRTCRRGTMLLKKLITMRDRVREDDGRMGFGMKYCGAAQTKRWSGDVGWNPQNLHKEELFGISIRSLVIPAPGKKFVICDLAQIEPRVLSTLIGDTEFLKLIASGMSPYEAHARLTMGFTGKNLKVENPKAYALAKARVLALGYGCGWERFITMARQYGAGEFFTDPVTPKQTEDFYSYLDWLAAKDRARTSKADLIRLMSQEQQTVCVNSWLQVSDFRRKNPKITGLWADMQELLQKSYGEDMTIGLPSGNTMTYRNIMGLNRQITAEVTKFGVKSRVKLYGGLLAENLIQGTARDVFGAAKLRLREAGFKIVLSIHDEVVIECDPSVNPTEIVEIMRVPPPWLKDCPVDAEAVETYEYMK